MTSDRKQAIDRAIRRLDVTQERAAQIVVDREKIKRGRPVLSLNFLK